MDELDVLRREIKALEAGITARRGEINAMMERRRQLIERREAVTAYRNTAFG